MEKTTENSFKTKEEIFNGIIGEQQVKALAAAIGQSDVEYLKTDFYCWYAEVMELEDEGVIKVDIVRLWDEYATEELLANVLPNILVSQSFLCKAKNSFKQLVKRFYASGYNNIIFRIVDFFKKCFHRIFNIRIFKLFKKGENFGAMNIHKPFRISLFTESTNFLKKPNHSIATGKISILFAHKIHTHITSQRPEENKKYERK